MSELGKNIKLRTDKAGYIKVDREQKTNVPGVFAAGDCCNNPTKRIIAAAADGSKAAEAAYVQIQQKRLLGNGRKAKK
jgi:thioredoxin reductase (NADPH)